MVGGSFIDIHKLTLEELAGVVNLYPWYGAARVEWCRRMSGVGGDSWGVDQFAREALYVGDRRILSALVRSAAKADCSDSEVSRLIASLVAPEPQASAQESHPVRVVGGDYFSQSQYDNVRSSVDNIFTRFAAKPRTPETDAGEDVSDMADRFATETLARIFAEQGRTEEARRIYSRLVLDFPEKSAYFAALIDKLN